MRRVKVKEGSVGHDAGRIDVLVRDHIVLLDVLKVDGRLDGWDLVQLFEVVLCVVVVLDALEVGFKMLHAIMF